MYKFSMSILLSPLSLLWGLIVWLRGKLFDWGWLPSRSFPLPVICVGNLAVGGTGKTPHVEHILRLLHAHGYRVAMLSRGYGRKTKGYVLAHERHTAEEIGDEPLQIRRNCPFATVAVCERRVEGIERLLQLTPAPQVVVLDDAYQHRYVRAGFNVLLTAASRLYTADHLLPWGRLREPAGAARRAQAIVVTKCPPDSCPALKVLPGQKLFYSRICYGTPRPWEAQLAVPQDDTASAASAPSLAGQKVLLVTGIAHPEPLIRHLQACGAAAVDALSFPDHHAFSRRDAERINSRYEQGAATCVLTTQKDATRLQVIQKWLSPELINHLLVQPITVKVEAAPETSSDFNQTILQYVDSHTRNSCVD